MGGSIRVEVDVAPGLPGFTVVGLGDTAVQEARERVRGAIRNGGFAFPPRRLTVNLAPAELRKTGASLDLAIAMGILLGSEQVRAGPVPVALIGELGLDGEVRPVPGILPMVAAMAARGIGRRHRGARSGGRGSARRRGGGRRSVDACGGSRASSAGSGRGADPWRCPGSPSRRHTVPSRTGPPRPCPSPDSIPDLAEVRGQAQARRALEIALAGGHGLLMTGPPGVGKTLLARTIPGLLPPLDDAAALSVDHRGLGGGGGSDRPNFVASRRSGRRITRCRMPRWSVVVPTPVAGRDHPRTPRRAVPRRACRVRSRRPRGTPPAARGGPDPDRPGRPRDDLSGSLPAHRGDEPVSLRVCRVVPGGSLSLHDR